MKTDLRIFWIISLTFFTAGCSGFQTACFTRAGDPGDVCNSPWEACDLHSGDKIRLTTLDGSRVVGRIDRISPECIVLQTDSHSEPTRLFSPSQVMSIEKSPAKPSEPPEIYRPEIGDEVTLYLVDGTKVEGEVQVINDKEIVLDHKGQSSQPRGYATEEVEWLEAAKGGGSSWVGPVVGIVVIGLVVGGIMVGKSLEGLNEPINIFGN